MEQEDMYKKQNILFKQLEERCNDVLQRIKSKHGIQSAWDEEEQRELMQQFQELLQQQVQDIKAFGKRIESLENEKNV